MRRQAKKKTTKSIFLKGTNICINALILSFHKEFKGQYSMLSYYRGVIGR